MQANKLSLNTDKTQLMILDRNRKDTNKYIIKNENPELVVCPVKSIKLLGLMISDDLKWTQYLMYGKDNLIKQLKKKNTMLFKVCKYTSVKNRINLANGIFGSKLLYGMEAWGTAPVAVRKKLQAQQTQALYSIHEEKSKRWTRTHLLKEAKWLTVDLQIKLTSVKLTQKILNNKGSEQLTALMKPDNTNKAQITRGTRPGKLGAKPQGLGFTEKN
jgi:hypothetical protein